MQGRSFLPGSFRHFLARLALLAVAVALLAASVWWDNAANRGVGGRARAEIPWADVPLGGVNTYGLHHEVVTAEQRLSGDNKVARTFEMLRDGGFHFARVQFPWEDIEVCGKGDFRDCRGGSEGQSTWIKYDYIVAQARQHDVELIVRLDRPPDWAREAALASAEVQAAVAVGRPVTGPPDRFEDYADFAGAIAHRYGDDLRFYQIWNEPNLPGEWNYRRQDPSDFVRLLRLAREAITTADADAVVLFPALSPTDGEDPSATNDLDYLQGIYDAGGRDAFDIMSAQLYGLGQPPEERRYVKPNTSLLRPIETRTDVGRVVLLREVMERNGDAGKAVWISELGWNSAPPGMQHPWGMSVTEEQKARYLVAAMERARREWPWVGAMCVWMFRWGGDAPHPSDPTPYFQLVDFDFRPLPAFSALADYLSALPPVSPARRQPLPLLAAALALAAVVAASGWIWPGVLRAGMAATRWSAHTARAGRRRMQPGARLGTAARLLHRLRRSDRSLVLLLALGVVVFYRASPQLPLTLLGTVLCLPVALLRPDLVLLLVAPAAALYLAPKGVWDARFGLSRPAGYFLPLHELLLLFAALGSAAHLLLRLPSLSRPAWRLPIPLPALVFAIAGTLGVAAAWDGVRGAALREWRWLVVEPLLFYALVRYYGRRDSFRRQIMWAWLVGGAVVACVGLLQILGLNLRPVITGQRCFSEAVVVAGGVPRATSIYCHPNNLGLALGRVWPVLAALGVGAAAGSVRMRVHDRGAATVRGGIGQVPLALAAVALAGLGTSFSKGALLGAFAALLVLGLLLRRRVLLLAGGAAAAGILLFGAVAGVDRLNPLGGSSGARLDLWSSAAAMLRDHPLLGVGLDQFYHLRNQAPSSPYLSPAAAATSERFASHPHNLVLDLLLRLGPLGLGVVALLVARFFRQARYVIRHGSGDERALAVGLVAAMVAALVHGLVDNFYFVPDLAIVFWLHLALVDLLRGHVTAASATASRPGA